MMDKSNFQRNDKLTPVFRRARGQATSPFGTMGLVTTRAHRHQNPYYHFAKTGFLSSHNPMCRSS